MRIHRKTTLRTLMQSTILCFVLPLHAETQNEPTNPDVQKEDNKSHSTSVKNSLSYTEEHQLFFQQRKKEQQATSFDEQPLLKDVNFYTRGLMQDLMANLSFVNEKTPLAVSSFVLLEGDYQTSNLLGLQITEALMHEVNKFGIPVIDFKATGNMEVTDSGDFFFSKDASDLEDDLPIRYVLTGTMVEQRGGYLVNARIIGVSSKAIVSSAQAFISAEASDAILKHANKPQATAVRIVGG